MQPSVNNQRGSILIVLLGVLMISGVFITFGIDFFNVDNNARARRQTISDMEVIVNAIASYTQKYNRIPCPAQSSMSRTDPLFGREAQAASSVTACTFNGALVPIRALNLPERFLQDSWGHYYTYAISPIYANTSTTTTVRGNCRTSSWIHSGTNLNPAKARFCCPGANASAIADLEIRGLDGNSVYGTRDSSNLGAVNTLFSGSQEAVETAAIVLISHGPNGSASYLPNLTGGRYPAVGDENENGLIASRLFIKNQQNQSDLTPFDDIVMYKSQIQLMAHLNDGSCHRPFPSYTSDIMDETY